MLLPSLLYGCTAYLIQKINNGIRPHIFCARRTSNKGWVWLQFSSCEAVGMFQAAARNYDLTLKIDKIGYPRLPIIHMDYPQWSPLQMAILSEKHALFLSSPPGAGPRAGADPIFLLRLRCPTRRWVSDQLGPSIDASENGRNCWVDDFLLVFWLIFPIFSWEFHGNPLGNPWGMDGFRGDFVFFWGGSWISKIQGPRPKDWCCQLPGKTPSRPSSRLPMPLQRCRGIGVSLPGATRIMEEILGILGILGLVWDNDG